MAIDWTVIYKPGRVRPPHLDDLIGIYQGETEDDFSATTDQSAVKTTINSAQSTVVDNFEIANDTLISTAIGNIDTLVDATSLSPEDKTSLKAAIASEINTTISPNYATHKTNLAAEVNSGVPSTATISKVEVLEDIKDEMNNEIAATLNSGTNFVDPRCGGTGRYPASNDPGETSSTDKHCVSCDGLGRTAEQNGAEVYTWSETSEFEL